jgi:hypothetical protein
MPRGGKQLRKDIGPPLYVTVLQGDTIERIDSYYLTFDFVKSGVPYMRLGLHPDQEAALRRLLNEAPSKEHRIWKEEKVRDGAE